MLTFEYKWMFLILPLPILIWWLMPPYRERVASVRVPLFDRLAAAMGQTPSKGAVILQTNILQKIAAPLTWALVVTSMARPVWVEPPIEKVEPARDLLLAVDISASMQARDFHDPQGNRVDRLTAVKGVIDEFVARRKGDRIGLIVFGGSAYPQAPFTLDHEAVRSILGEVEIGMAGPRTMIGDAIGLGIKMFEQSKVKQKVMVLLTDGNDTGSKMPPSKAAEIAKDHGIVIHTIAIGDPRASGEDRVDLQGLGDISTATGGQSFRGEDRKRLEEIYRTLDQLTPENFKDLSYRPKRPLFQWPLAAAVLLLIGYHAVILLWRLLNRRGSARHAEAVV